MKKKILMLLGMVLAVAILTTPMVGTVMAIGPLRALEVGKNPKVDGFVPAGFVMLDDVGPNNIFWANMYGRIVSGADALKGEGRMNNAIIADYGIVVDIQTNPEMYENKWVFLSGAGGALHDGHSMAYWLLLPWFGPTACADLEVEYWDGIFYKLNLVG
jgi:hypothetical protein